MVRATCLAILGALALACTRPAEPPSDAPVRSKTEPSETPETAHAAERGESGPRADSDADADSDTDADVDANPATADANSATARSAPDPTGFGDACDDANPCGWDDPCVPQRCVAHPPADLDCEETAPAPGACTCLAGHCTLRPDSPPPPPTAGCAVEACGLDMGAGRCTVDSMLEANRAARDEGPACHCEGEPPSCAFTWAEPIACEDERDCWVSDSPPYHPVARPQKLRKRKFEPCRDGEIAPVCRRGVCRVLAYSC